MWSELVTLAVVGTARNGFRIPASAGPLSPVFAQLADAPAEHALLAAAALVTQARRAGRKPDRPDARIPTAAPETAQPCGSHAASHLALLLDMPEDQRLAEWLDRAAALGLRIPPEHLPALLEAGKASRALRTRIVKVAGQRGRWLAAQNAEWRYAAGDDDDDALWQTGGAETRLILFETLRQSDPARARAFLAQTWRQESTDFKARAVPLLSNGLSAEDEPLLEDALNERRQDIRADAAEILARLPRSAFRARALERACRYLAVAGGTLAITLPDAFDPSWQRDGIVEKAPPAGSAIGPRAWWLLQMLRHAPARELRERLTVSGEAWVALARTTEYGTPYMESIALAACLDNDGDTLTALLAAAAETLEDDDLFMRIVESAPTGPAESCLARLVQHPSFWFEPRSRPALALREVRRTWSIGLGRAALGALRAAVNASPVEPAHFAGINVILWHMALRMPASLCAEAATDWPRNGETWASWEWLITDFLAKVQFRHDMLSALDASAAEAAAIATRPA